MDRIPTSPPAIAPLPPGLARPRWSVMIPAYNCAQFLTQTLTSVLAQDPGPQQMQIEVIDDASTDADVAALVARVGQGRVGYYRQPANVGSLRNFETCLTRSRGELVHLLHGDDRVLPGFYERLGGLLARYPQAGAAFSNYYNIDAGSTRDRQFHDHEQATDGLLDGWLYKIATRQRLQYVSMVVRRSVYEELGGFYGVTYGEDWEMWVRIASRYAVAYCPERLAEYRYHPHSITSQKLRAGQVLQDLSFVIDKIRQYIPASEQNRIWHKSMNHYSGFELHSAFNHWKRSGNSIELIASVQHILRIYSSLTVYLLIVELFLKKSLQRFGILLQKNQNMAEAHQSPTWTWEFTNKASWWQIGLLDVFAYRSLLARLIRRDFLVSYQQTLLGPLWTLIQPILTVLTYVLVFNKLVGMSTSSVPPALFYLTGTILWNLFNDVFTNTSTTFTANSALFSKVYFPRLVIPLAALSAQLIRMLIQVGLLAVVLAGYWVSGRVALHIDGWILLVPIILLYVALFGLALGLLFSVVTAKYRDLTNVVMLIMRMLMFVTPVIYPLAIVPERSRWIVALNPLTPLFELFRYVLVGQGDFTAAQLLYSSSSIGLLLLLGILLFNRQKEALMDVL